MVLKNEFSSKKDKKIIFCKTAVKWQLLIYPATWRDRKQKIKGRSLSYK